jgi:cellulose biosynthesis protein BcsQ
MELVIFSAMEGLQTRLEVYRNLALLTLSRIEQVQRLLDGSQPPDVLYLDDTRSLTQADIWQTVQRSRQAGTRILLNLQGHARNSLHDARSAGIETLSDSDPAIVAEWIGAQLGLERGEQASQTPMIAIGAAKGGIGKTFVTCILAEGLRRRGLNVLVWDSDISNPGIVPAFRISSSAPSYLHLIQRGPSHWNPDDIRSFIFEAEHTRPTANGWGKIDFLIGSHTLARADQDVRLPDWQGFYQAVSHTEGYDLILIDTPPDYLRRPYATHLLQCGGTVILPTPPGARERMGVGHMLDHFREHAADRLDHCWLLFVEPERGVIATVRDVEAMLARRYPQVQRLGVIPRTPRLASLADEQENYVSMLEIGPHSRFSRAVHEVADTLCIQLGITPPLPQPRSSIWARLQAQLSGRRDPVGNLPNILSIAGD